MRYVRKLVLDFWLIFQLKATLFQVTYGMVSNESSCSKTSFDVYFNDIDSFGYVVFYAILTIYGGASIIAASAIFFILQNLQISIKYPIILVR